MATGLQEVVQQFQRGSLPRPSADLVASFSGRAAARDLATVLDQASGAGRSGAPTPTADPSDLEPAASEAR